MKKVSVEIDPRIYPIIEGLKEPLREIVLAALPGVLLYIEKLDAPWAAVLYFALRALDSYLHEKGKIIRSELLTKGLTRF